MKTKVENVYVYSKEISDYFKLYMKIKKILESQYNPELEKLFQPIKEIFYELRSSIEEYNVKLDKIFMDEDWERIRMFFSQFVLYGEDYGEISDQLFKIILKIRNGEVVNKTKEWLTTICYKYRTQRVAVIANYPEYDSELLKQHSNLIFLKPNQLMRGLEIYDVLIFLGTPNFFNEFNNVFFGTTIHYVSYDFYRNEFKKSKVLTPLQKKLNTIYGNVRVFTNEKQHHDINSTPIEMVNESAIFVGVPENIMKLSTNSLEEDNVVEARFIRLTNNRGLIALKNSTLRVIEMVEKDNEINVSIIRKKLNDLTPADKIIITLYTNPTFLEQYSIKKLGEVKYEKYQHCVNQYKEKLKEAKDILGTYQRLMRELNNNGVMVSDLQVLKNWMGEKTVRPRQLKELLIFLKFEDSQIGEIMEAAKEINTTRRRAGIYKSRNIAKLLKKIEGEDIEYNKAIYSEDNFVFSISEIGKYSIETVVNVIKKKIYVHTSELYKIQKL